MSSDLGGDAGRSGIATQVVSSFPATLNQSTPERGNVNGSPQGTAEPADAAPSMAPAEPGSRLPGRALTYLNLKAAIVWAITMTAGLVVHLALPGAIPVWLLVVAAAVATITLITDIALVHRWHIRTYRYELTETATRISHGRIFLRERSIPTNRTFGVELVQGPLLRAFDLAELRIVTVVGSNPLGPVPRPEADRIRTTVTGAAERGLHA